MSIIQTIAGIVTHVGAYTSDATLNTYARIELQTDAGLVALENVMASSACGPALSVGKDVAICLSEQSEAASRSLVWAVRDVEAGVTFSSNDLWAARDVAITQCISFTVMSLILIPVGLVCLVAPGIYVGFKLWEAWAKTLAFPSKQGIEAAVAAMDAIQPPVFAMAA